MSTKWTLVRKVYHARPAPHPGSLRSPTFPRGGRLRFEDYAFPLVRFEDYAFLLVCFEDYALPLVRFEDYAFLLVCFEDYALPLVRFEDYAFPLVCFEDYALPLWCVSRITPSPCCASRITPSPWCASGITPSPSGALRGLRLPPEGEGAERREAEEGCAPYAAFFCGVVFFAML